MCSGTKGILRNKINYRKYKPSKKTTEQHYIDEPEPNGEVECMTEQINEMSVEDELTCLLFFKTCIIDRDKEILKIKMKQTIKLREKTIRKRDTKFVEVFPFYFVAPDLVSEPFCFEFNFQKIDSIQFNSLLIVLFFRFCLTIQFDSSMRGFCLQNGKSLK